MAKETTTKKKTALEKITPEMLEAIKELLAQKKDDGKEGMSIYSDVRDPKKIETARIKRIDGMFVIGFKDVNDDPYETRPRYTTEEPYLGRGLKREPHITLLLSKDGETVIEKKMAHIDYMTYRKELTVPVIEVIKKEIIEDGGLLGVRRGAVTLGEDGRPTSRVAVRKEVRREELSLVLDVPGFSSPLTIKSEFLA